MPPQALGAERFLREFQIALRLNHPHILPLHDSGEADGLLYCVMPYVEGESLRERLTRDWNARIHEPRAGRRRRTPGRSHRQLMEQLDYNILCRWSVGLQLDDPVWAVTVFTLVRLRSGCSGPADRPPSYARRARLA